MRSLWWLDEKILLSVHPAGAHSYQIKHTLKEEHNIDIELRSLEKELDVLSEMNYLDKVKGVYKHTKQFQRYYKEYLA